MSLGHIGVWFIHATVSLCTHAMLGRELLVDIGDFTKLGGVARFDFLGLSLVFCASCLSGGVVGYATLSIFGVGVVFTVQAELVL